MNKPARYNHFCAQRRSKCSLCMIFNGLSRNTFNADTIFFRVIPTYQGLDNNYTWNHAITCTQVSVSDGCWHGYNLYIVNSCTQVI